MIPILIRLKINTNKLLCKSQIASQVHILVSSDFYIFSDFHHYGRQKTNRELSHLETAFRKSAKKCTRGAI